MTDAPVQMAALAAAVLVLAATWTSGGLPGLVIGPDASPQPPRFEDAPGSFEDTVDGGAWYAFAIPVTADLEASDLRIAVTYTLENPGQRDGQFWHMRYIGPRSDGFPDAPSNIFWPHYPTDGPWEVGAQAAGHSVEVAAPSPFCAVEVCWPGEQWNLTFDLQGVQDKLNRYFDWFRENEPDPVLHVLLMVGGLEPVRTHVEASWQDTDVNVTSGPFEDAFTYYHEDFRSTLFVRADAVNVPAPIVGYQQPYYQENATLRTDLVEPGKSVFHNFQPWASDPARGGRGMGYQRPDGTTFTGFEAMFGFGDEVGTWRYWFNGSLHDDADDHVLFGSNFDWAEAP